MIPEEQKLASCLAQASSSLDRWICTHPGLAEAVLFTGLPFALILVSSLAIVSFMRRRRPFAPTLPMFFSDLGISSALLTALFVAIAMLRGLLDLQRTTTP